MDGTLGDERQRLLDPVDRISEILFGPFMAVTIVGSLSVATAGQNEARTVTVAAFGGGVRGRAHRRRQGARWLRILRISPG